MKKKINWNRIRPRKVKIQEIDKDTVNNNLNEALRDLFKLKVKAKTVDQAIGDIVLAVINLNGRFYKDVWEELEKRGYTIDERRKA